MEERMVEKKDRLGRWMRILAVLLIVLGLTIMIPKVNGMVDFYREMQYAREHGFEQGNPDPALIRPWMTIRYLAVSYAVPQKYLFDAAHIQPHPETSMLSIQRLNQQMKLGQQEGEPVLLRTLRQAVMDYRANPQPTGLMERTVADWMSVQYLANSTGIAPETFFAAANIEMDGNAFLPLGYLSDKVDYPGGVRQLLHVLQQVIDAKGGNGQ